MNVHATPGPLHTINKNTPATADMAARRPCGHRPQLHALSPQCHQQHAVRRGHGKKEGAGSPRPKPTIRPEVGTVLICPGLPHAKQSGQHTLQAAAKQSGMLGSMDAMLTIGLPMPVMIKLTRVNQRPWACSACTAGARQEQPQYVASHRQAEADAITVPHPLYCPSQHERMCQVCRLNIR